MGNHKKLINFHRADPAAAQSSPRSFCSSTSVSDDDGTSYTSASSFPASTTSSPSRYSPPRSPWAHLPGLGGAATETATRLIASLVKADGGKVYSLAAVGDVLYTGTDSETVRVWRDRRELAGFRTGSGLVKAIVVTGDGRIFTGHQDGKVRVWRADGDPAAHRRVGSLPALGDYLISSVNPSCYVETQSRRGRRRAVWLRHLDAVSCLSLDEGAGLLYSGSWDWTFKVWRVSDSRCLESVSAHDDAVNTVEAAGFDGLVLSGAADGTVKVWRREVADPKGDKTRHVLDRVLRKGDGAVTAIAVSPEARVVYIGSSDGLVTSWWWPVNGEPVSSGVLAGHHEKMAVMCLAASGTVVVSGSADRTLCVWQRDGAEHFLVAVLAGHTGPVKCVAVADEEGDADSGDRRFVVYSGSLDGSVKVWRLPAEHTSDSPAAPAEQSSLPASPPPPPYTQTLEPLLLLPSAVQQALGATRGTGAQSCGSCLNSKRSATSMHTRVQLESVLGHVDVRRIYGTRIVRLTLFFFVCGRNEMRGVG